MTSHPSSVVLTWIYSWQCGNFSWSKTNSSPRLYLKASSAIFFVKLEIPVFCWYFSIFTLKAVFSNIRVRKWVQVVSRQKPGLWLADLAVVYQLEVWIFVGNNLNSCPDSGFQKKLPLANWVYHAFIVVNVGWMNASLKRINVNPTNLKTVLGWHCNLQHL